MKLRIYLLLLALLPLACVEKDTEPLFTEVTITVQPPEGIEMVRFQATMVFENINTRQKVSTSDFINGRLEVRLLKGLYRLSINEGGGMTYYDAEGRHRFSEVVVDNTPMKFVADSNAATIDLIFKN